MKAAHTPGPWKKDDGVVVKDELTVADCYGKTHAEMNANARLIAAAPELVDMCKICWAALTVVKHGRSFDIDKTMRLIAATIEKATGETSEDM
jgi:hypothetical protein